MFTLLVKTMQRINMKHKVSAAETGFAGAGRALSMKQRQHQSGHESKACVEPVSCSALSGYGNGMNYQ